MKKAKYDKIVKFMMDNSYTLADMVDATIINNKIVGVGLISFGEELKSHCYNKVTSLPKIEE